MTTLLAELCFDANDPLLVARFWSGVLGRQLSDDGVTLRTDEDASFPIRFRPTQEAKTQPNQMHFDLTSTSLDDQQQTVARALELGGRHLDIGQGPDADHVVLADPEGNEFCAIPPGNNFLAGCGFLGALSSDGSYAVGHFWSAALDWPLVWDQDGETAIQSPQGGTKISWGGPPVQPKVGKNRLHLHLGPSLPDEGAAEVARLVGLGATRIGVGQCGPGWVAMTDVDGNELCVRVEA